MLASNNRYAIDALLDGHDPEHYLDCVVPNPYIVKAVFETFTSLKANEIYEKSLRVFLGFLSKVYFAAEEGYQMYPVTLEHVNSLGKFLDKSQDQEWPLNRGILDVLAAIADLDKPHETGRKETQRRGPGRAHPLGLLRQRAAPEPVHHRGDTGKGKVTELRDPARAHLRVGTASPSVFRAALFFLVDIGERAPHVLVLLFSLDDRDFGELAGEIVMHILDALEDVVGDGLCQRGVIRLEAQASLAQLEEHLAPHFREGVEAHAEELHVVAQEVLDLQRREVAGLLNALPSE